MLEVDQDTVDQLHSDNEFLLAAMIGNDKRMMLIIRIKNGLRPCSITHRLSILYTAGHGSPLKRVKAEVPTLAKCRSASEEQFTELLAKDNLGRTALHLAAATGNLKCVDLALRVGIKPNVKDKFGMTALGMCLMRRPSLQVVKLLFQNGATLTERESQSDTGLFLQFVMLCVPTEEEKAILRLLVEKGACLNDINAPGQRQALHFAAMSNNCELIKLLVELGANLFITNHRNETPLEVAVSFKCRAAVDLLSEMERSYVRSYKLVREKLNSRSDKSKSSTVIFSQSSTVATGSEFFDTNIA